MRPLSILAISSRSVFIFVWRSGVMSDRLRASSSRGAHSCAEPRAMVKKLRRSGVVKRPLPTARFAAIDNDARLSWSARKPWPRGKASVVAETWSAKSTDLWWTMSYLNAKAMRGESRKETPEVSSTSAGVARFATVASPLYFLLSPALLPLRGNRGDKTPVELFLAGIRVFDPAKAVWLV